METTLSSNFSRNRIKMIARYYYPSLRIQLILYPLVSAIFGILTYFSTNGSLNLEVMSLLGIFVVGVIGMIQPFMLYFAPGFLVKSSRNIDVTIPALWTEKATFILLYFFVAVPAMLYLPGKICFILLQLILQTGSFHVSCVGATLNLGATQFSMSSYFTLLIPVSVFAFVFFRTPRPSFGKAALFSIIAYFSYSILIGIAVFIIGMNSGLFGMSGDNLVATITDRYEWIYTIISALVAGLFIWLTGRTFKNLQL